MNSAFVGYEELSRSDTSMLAAQMENLGFREKAGSSGKRVDNGADSRHDSQVCPATKIVILRCEPNCCAGLRDIEM